MYKAVWTPLALAFVAFPLSCGSLSIFNVVCSAVLPTPREYEPCIYHMHLIKGCGRCLKSMRLTVKYTLNNEVRLTTGVYGIHI